MWGSPLWEREQSNQILGVVSLHRKGVGTLGQRRRLVLINKQCSSRRQVSRTKVTCNDKKRSEGAVLTPEKVPHKDPQRHAITNDATRCFKQKLAPWEWTHLEATPCGPDTGRSRSRPLTLLIGRSRPLVLYRVLLVEVERLWCNCLIAVSEEHRIAAC